MENNNLQNSNNQTKHSPYATGFLSGLFAIIGIFAGFLYTGEERHDFIDGWKAGFFTTIALAIIAFFVVRFGL